MNWYSVFYWITVADGVKSFFDVFSNIFTIFAAISLIIYVILLGCRASDDCTDEESMNFWVRRFARFFWFSMIFTVLTWGGYMFTPSKKDALIIVAGGSVGNFITSDSSAKALPAEVMTLLRDKIRSEIREANASSVTDTLANKSAEELREIIKNQKQAQ